MPKIIYLCTTQWQLIHMNRCKSFQERYDCIPYRSPSILFIHSFWNFDFEGPSPFYHNITVVRHCTHINTSVLVSWLVCFKFSSAVKTTCLQS